MILEFKSTNGLHWKDFEPACQPDIASIRKSVRGQTLLDNVEVISKQESKYSNKYYDIILFN